MPLHKKTPKNPEESSQAQQPIAVVDCMQAFILFFFSDCSCK
jgi:hypothetical protein